MHEILEQASRFIGDDRADEYGTGPATFPGIAALWSAAFDWDVDPHDVALAMILVKIVRLANSPEHHDSWADIAGYAALGYDSARYQRGAS